MMRIEQNVYPTAANDRLIFFQTSLHLPLAEKTFTERNLCEVFDRKTGTYIPKKTCSSVRWKNWEASFWRWRICPTLIG